MTMKLIFLPMMMMISIVANIASCCKEIYGERSMLFRRIFIINELDNVNMRELLVFVEITTKSCYRIYRYSLLA